MLKLPNSMVSNVRNTSFSFMSLFVELRPLKNVKHIEGDTKT